MSVLRAEQGAAGSVNLSTENWSHAYDPVPSRRLVPNGFTSHRGEDVLRAFSFGSELGSRPWTQSVADDHCHQHVDRRVKAGYSVAEELPIFSLLFPIPAVVAMLVRWRFCIRLRQGDTMGKNRLEAFSDGVIAIIITIMVLEMKIPHGDSFGRWRPSLPVFMSYVLSFVYVGIYWNNHHHMLNACTRVTGGILWANLHLSFWLSLFPFVTGWMGENHFAPVPSALYGGVLLAAAFAYLILQQTIIASQARSRHSRRRSAAIGRGSCRLSCICVQSSPRSYGCGWLRRCTWWQRSCGWCLIDELRSHCMAIAPIRPANPDAINPSG